MSFIDCIYIKLFYKKMGKDQFGNEYFIGNRSNYLGHKKRYVIYQGIQDGSKVPAMWHSWLHYFSNEVPDGNHKEKYKWQIKHIQNLTGSKIAYSPFRTQNIVLDCYSSWRP